jgi:Arylesterase
MTSRHRNRIVAILAACLLGTAGLVFWSHGPSRQGSPIDGACRGLVVSAHVPDIAADEIRGVAYLAYLDTRKRSATKAARGTVMLLDLNVAEPLVRAALVTDPQGFQPVGLSLFAPAQGPRRLLVIDRGTGKQSAVRIFEQSPSGVFELVKTVRDPLLRSPVAITAVGPEQFYVRNDASGTGAFARLRALLRLSRPTVVYYDGTRMSGASTRAQKAAGMSLEPEDRPTYVSATIGKRLEVIERDEQSSELLLCTVSRITTP